MPPITRRSQAGGIAKRGAAASSTSVTKPVPSRLRETSSSWDFLEHDEAAAGHDDHIMHDGPTEDNQQLQLAPLQSPLLNETLHPLRAISERVGREVETFAETLDQFLDAHTAEQENITDRVGGVMGLVDEFKHICRDAIFALERQHTAERARLLRREWGAMHASLLDSPSTTAAGGRDKEAALTERKASQVRQLRRWQQELDIWELFGAMLELHWKLDADAERQDREAQLAQLGPPNRYTTEDQLWQRFLVEDDLARERAVVKAWLESTADHQESDLPGIVEELETKAARGKGLWSHGWMHTREKIKGEKRLRSWPKSGPGSAPQLKRSDNNELLVTALDPDATSRQGRSLEKPDAYFERAVWIACWEMLRRGKSVQYVSEWCDHRKEGWRAVSIGRATETTDVLSGAAWRKVCNLAAETGCSNEYETAVYGLLGGNVKAVQRICRTVDDHLYAYYSTALTQQFEQYLAANFPDRLPTRHDLAFDEHQDPQRAIVDLITKLRARPSTTAESVQPLKIIESYLLAHDFDSMIYAVGHAVSYEDSIREDFDDAIMRTTPFWHHEGNLPEVEIARDPQALRIAVHIKIILSILRNDAGTEEARAAEQNVLVAYIQTLRAAGKRDLIPLYASRLSPARWAMTISTTMQDITEIPEQEQTLKLLETYGRDIVLVLNEQLAKATTRALGRGIQPKKPLRMLEDTEELILYPGQRIIRGFLPEFISEEDERVISSLRWFNLLHGHWKDTFRALSSTLRKCLKTGRIACAVRIVHEFPYEDISIRKSYQVIGKSLDMMDLKGRAPANESALWDQMKEQSTTYYDLCQLVTAIEALARWRDLEYAYVHERPKLTSAPPELKAAKEAADDAMLPVLVDCLLCNGVTEKERADLAAIRIAYIPEIVIAYNTMLHSAGSIITRQALIESMDLAVMVAKDEYRVGDCFVQAGRMRELVTSFAHTSKAMLLLKGQGRPWNPRRDREGKDLGMWEIGPQGTLDDSDAPARQIPPMPQG